MSRMTLLVVGTLLCLLLLAFSACNFPASRADVERLEARLRAQEEKASVPWNRFELHEIRNGPVISTALLDKQTGRVWVVTGKQVDKFDPMPIVTFNPKFKTAGFTAFVPPAAPTLEIELPTGWTAAEIKAEASQPLQNPYRPPTKGETK
jgi:hypothetical protein